MKEEQNPPVTNNVHKGTIVAFYGEVIEIPEGWVLCDGSNDTPNLCGRTLIGSGLSSWGTTYTFGDTGGESTHVLTPNEMPSHNHTSGTSNFLAGNQSSPTNKVEGGDWGTSFIQMVTTNTGEDGAHNNMQPYFVMHYIMYLG